MSEIAQIEMERIKLIYKVEAFHSDLNKLKLKQIMIIEVFGIDSDMFKEWRREKEILDHKAETLYILHDAIEAWQSVIGSKC